MSPSTQDENAENFLTYKKVTKGCLFPGMRLVLKHSEHTVFYVSSDSILIYFFSNGKSQMESEIKHCLMYAGISKYSVTINSNIINNF